MFPGPDSQKIIGFSQILISDLKPGLPYIVANLGELEIIVIRTISSS